MPIRHVQVYYEKFLCHDVAEARQLRKMARRSKAPAQMGNQGHCEEGYRRLCEFVWAGVVGKITETRMRGRQRARLSGWECGEA